VGPYIISKSERRGMSNGGESEIAYREKGDSRWSVRGGSYTIVLTSDGKRAQAGGGGGDAEPKMRGNLL